MAAGVGGRDGLGFFVAAGVGRDVGVGGDVAHLAQHGGATGAEEAEQQRRADGEEEEIQC